MRNIRDPRTIIAIIGGLTTIATFLSSGCGSSTSNTCDGIQGQFTSGNQTSGQTLVIYSLTGCDPNGNNCQQTQVAKTTTDSTGHFSVSGLPDGNYLAAVYASDNTTIVDQKDFSVPGICSGGPVSFN